MSLYSISDEEQVELMPRHHTRTAIYQTLGAFRDGFLAWHDEVDVLVMGPEGGWHECANANRTPIGVEQAMVLVAQRIAQLYA